MKKILLATALVSASTGFAAAEVTLSGDARMGLIYDGDDVSFTSRARVKFSMVGTTDGGLEFGASFRAADAVAANGNTAMTAGSVYISGGFGKLTFGDVDSAANALVGNVSGVGLTGLGDLNELGYLGHPKTAALYEFTTGALTFALSAGQPTATRVISTDDPTTPAVEPTVTDDDDAVSVAAKYATDSFSVALGVEERNSTTHVALGGSATFGAATVKAVVSDAEGRADTHFALSVDYVAGATTVTAFVTDQGAVNNFGIGAAYDLGGGAKVVGGIVRADAAGDTIADLGISMSF